MRLREEINSILEFLPTQGTNEETPDTSPATTQPQDSKKKQKDPPASDALMNSVLGKAAMTSLLVLCLCLRTPNLLSTELPMFMYPSPPLTRMCWPL